MRWEFKILVKNKLIDMMGKDKEKALSIVGEINLPAETITVIVIIFTPLFCHWISLEKTFWPGREANLRHWYHLTDMLESPKKGSIKSRAKQHCLSHSSCVNSHIMTDAILLCSI